MRFAASHVMTETWTDASVRDALPPLLASHGMTLRALARDAGLSHSHLSRVLAGKNGKVVSGNAAARIAMALGLPQDYFPEYRVAAILEAVSDDAALRDRLYGALGKVTPARPD